jgi:signal transduction histidine kinase
VCFVVSDNGPGVSSKVKDRLFDPGVTTKTGGWGVGLSLARRIAEDVHGGSIDSRPRSAGGARFAIHVPLEEAGAGGEGDRVARCR